jgi:hypothetical protein
MYITQKQLFDWATQIANVINHSALGECLNFESEFKVGNRDFYSARVSYTCSYDGGWSVDNEQTKILWVTDPFDRDVPELIPILEGMLN